MSKVSERKMETGWREGRRWWWRARSELRRGRPSAQESSERSARVSRSGCAYYSLRLDWELCSRDDGGERRARPLLDSSSPTSFHSAFPPDSLPPATPRPDFLPEDTRRDDSVPRMLRLCSCHPCTLLLRWKLPRRGVERRRLTLLEFLSLGVSMSHLLMI